MACSPTVFLSLLLSFAVVGPLWCGGPLWAQTPEESTPAADEATTPEADAPAVDPQLAEKLRSPRATMETFLSAVNDDRLADAALCLDLSEVGLTGGARDAKGPEYAYMLKEIIDRMVRIDYSRIRVSPEEEQLFRLNYVVSGMEDRDLSDAALVTIAPDENNLWRFTSGTVASLDELYARWKDRPQRQIFTTSRAHQPFSIWLAERFPGQQETHFLIPDYQWICLALLIFVGFVADLITRGLLNFLTHAWLKYRGSALPEERRLWKPVGLFVQALTWYAGTRLIGLPGAALDVLLLGLQFFAVVAAVWTGFRMIDLLAAVVARRAKITATKFDDLLVPLISKSLKAIVICVGVLQCAQAFDLPIAGLLGGLGIGGAALALASQDAVSNLFGSITVLMDRPFEVGDWVITDNIEGSVENVGFRSTRIRTFYNSLVTLPNSRLTTAVVDNMGRRRFRRLKMTLGVQYDTHPEQIEAFCEGVRELIRRHPYTRKDYYHVYFNAFSGSSLDILLYCFLDCPDWSIELRERHRLLLDILRLAKQLEISFAFPTRSVHLHQVTDELQEATVELDDPMAAGQVFGAQIAKNYSERRLGPVEFRGPTELKP